MTRAHEQWAPCPRPPAARPKGSMPVSVRRFDSASRPGLQRFSQRHMAKFLGRVREVRRQLAQGRNPVSLRQALARRWPAHIARDIPWARVQQIAEECLDQSLQQEAADRLRVWRREISKCGRTASKWLRQVPEVASPNLWLEDPRAEGDKAARFGGDLGRVSSNIDEGFDLIREFWSQFWDRPHPDVDSALREWSQAMGPTPALQWEPVEAAELQHIAREAAGSAAGPDGWCGVEISVWPACAWAQWADLVNRWVSRGELPEALKHMYQVQLPKPGASSQGLTCVAKLRPIVVQSILWRTVCSALARRPCTREWVEAILPAQAYGGIREREAAQAIIALSEHWRQQRGVLVSLDYAKAFDTVSPRLATRVLAQAGMPRAWVQLVEQVWGHQSRILTSGGEVDTVATKVDRSIPQGDAFSPLALILLLAAPTKHILRSEQGAALEMATFIDDRAFSCSTPAQAARVVSAWRGWGSGFGMLENLGKIRLVAHTAMQREGLRRAGFDAQCVVDTARVLGFDMCSDRLSPIRPTVEERQEEALGMARRLVRLPSSLQVRRRLWRSRIVPKAAWGLGLRLPRTQDLRAVLGTFRQALRKPRMASPWLFSLMEGHSASIRFRAGCDAAMQLYRTWRKRPIWWNPTVQLGTWVGEVRSWFRSLGWREHEPWHWEHPSMGHMNWDQGNGERFKHQLRESWREGMFYGFLQQQRRDSRELRDTPYDAGLAKRAQNLYHKDRYAWRGIMCGAALSVKVQCIIRGIEIESCPFCNQSSVPTWEHCAWQCASFVADRPPRPQARLQARLGWPCSNTPQYDEHVLEHLTRVRAAVWGWQYRDGGGAGHGPDAVPWLQDGSEHAA